MSERTWRLVLRWAKGPRLETYKTAQPWVIYTYFVPDWLTRVLGRTAVRCECLICGQYAFPTLRMPRWGKIEDQGHHPARTAFLAAHRHPGVSGNPMSWERPLRNMAALRDGDLEDVLGVVAERAFRAPDPEEGVDDE